MKIVDVEGIGPVYAGKLLAADIQTTDDLLEAGRTPAGRHRIAEATGISAKLLLEWINHADLMRIHGVGSEYADLLEAAGVDTVVELSGRNPHNLEQALIDTNNDKSIVRRIPPETAVAGWIAEAKRLERAIEY